jgi:hypothetical protein
MHATIHFRKFCLLVCCFEDSAVILTVVWYECETWCHTGNEELSLNMFENGVEENIWTQNGFPFTV